VKQRVACRHEARIDPRRLITSTLRSRTEADIAASYESINLTMIDPELDRIPRYPRGLTQGEEIPEENGKR